MMRLQLGSSRRQRFSARNQRVRPQLESLEDRRLLYATLGANWAHPIKITYSFVPDGTMIGGAPSALYQTLNAKFSTETWQREFDAAAATWQAVANINMVRVSDAGGTLDIYGNQQGDPRFGDIRICAIPLTFGTMGAAFSPPPINGGTLAGDVVINSIMDWSIHSHWNLRTVAIHEFGHALGMSHAAINNAVMFSYYTVIKQNLHADDIAGIRSIYQARQPDGWNSNGQSNAFSHLAKSLDSRLTPQSQIQVQWLNFHNSPQAQWFWVTIPPANNGQLVAQAQATGFSLLSPKLEIFDASMNFRGEATTSKFGDTVTATIPGVSQGQGFFIKVSGGGATITGVFGLQINFNTTPLTPLTPAYPAVPWQPSQGGGLASLRTGDGDLDNHVELVRIGDIAAWGDTLKMPGGGHAPEYLAAVDQGARRLDALATTSILASAANDLTASPALESVSPTVSPKRADPVSPSPRTSAPFRSWRGWAFDADRKRSAIGSTRLVGSLGVL